MLLLPLSIEQCFIRLAKELFELQHDTYSDVQTDGRSYGQTDEQKENI